MHFVLLCIAIILIVFTTAISNNRLGLSEIYPQNRISKDYLVGQKYGISSRLCFLNCFYELSCLSFSTTSNRCFLYGTDYRLSSVLEPAKAHSLFSLKLHNGLQCYTNDQKQILAPSENCLLGVKVYTQFWGEWSDWSYEWNNTCGGLTITGRQTYRDCFSIGLPFGLTKNPCIGSNVYYQKKTVKFFNNTSDKLLPSKQLCDQYGLQLFTAFFLLCDESGILNSNMIFWTGFWFNVLDGYFHDTELHLKLSPNDLSPLWSPVPKYYWFAEFCVQVENMALTSMMCDSLFTFSTNIVVCDIYE